MIAPVLIAMTLAGQVAPHVYHNTGALLQGMTCGYRGSSVTKVYCVGYGDNENGDRFKLRWNPVIKKGKCVESVVFEDLSGSLTIPDGVGKDDTKKCLTFGAPIVTAGTL